MSTKSLWWWTSGQFRMRLRWTTDIEKVRKNHRHDCSILLKWWLCDIRRKWRQPSESERLRCWTRVSLCRIPRSKLRDLQTKTCWCNVNKLGVGWFTMTAHQCLKRILLLKNAFLQIFITFSLTWNVCYFAEYSSVPISVSWYTDKDVFRLVTSAGQRKYSESSWGIEPHTSDSLPLSQ